MRNRVTLGFQYTLAAMSMAAVTSFVLGGFGSATSSRVATSSPSVTADSIFGGYILPSSEDDPSVAVSEATSTALR